MIRPEQIPDEVVEAFQRAWANKDTLSTKECLAAALSAWPGAMTEWNTRARGKAEELILPLPSDAEGPDVQ